MIASLRRSSFSKSRSDWAKVPLALVAFAFAMGVVAAVGRLSRISSEAAFTTLTAYRGEYWLMLRLRWDSVRPATSVPP